MLPSLDTNTESIILGAPLFTGVDRCSVFNLLHSATLHDYPKGKNLFLQGDPAKRFYLVIEGRVKLYTLHENGERSVIGFVEKGQTFAEAAIFSTMFYPVSAEVLPNSRLLEVPAEYFLGYLSEHTGLAAKLLASLGRWQRLMLNEISILKNRLPLQRVGLYFLAQASQHREGDWIDLPLTKKEIASCVGVTPESFSRILQRLKPVGVEVGKKNFRVNDFKKLRNFCGHDQ